MGTVSITSISDGSTASASQVNTPLNTLANVINGNLDSDNLAANAVTTAKIADANVTNAKLATGAGEAGGAWASWTPTFTNFTLGNGTINSAVWTKVGKTISYRLRVTLGTTSVVGTDVMFTLPTTAATGENSGTAPFNVIGSGVILDTGVAQYAAFSAMSSTTQAWVVINNTASAYGLFQGITATIPMTWAASDVFYVRGTYEAN